MDLDLLKKLVKLANHNSNEHEANSAARRVCQMIEKANFSLDDLYGYGPTIKVKPPPRYDIPKKEKPPIHHLECSFCHKMVETVFVGQAFAFICKDCIWSRYTGSKV